MQQQLKYLLPKPVAVVAVVVNNKVHLINRKEAANKVAVRTKEVVSRAVAKIKVAANNKAVVARENKANKTLMNQEHEQRP